MGRQRVEILRTESCFSPIKAAVTMPLLKSFGKQFRSFKMPHFTNPDFTVCCKEVLAQEKQDNVFLIPVLFQYGDCYNPNMLQELLLHLATQSLNTSQSYKFEYYTRNNFLGFGGSFHSPHTAMLISIFTQPGDYQIPEQYCRYYNVTGIVVTIKKSPDIAGVAIFRAAHYIQELPIYSHNANIADEIFDSYEYYLLYGANEPGEIDAFVIGSIYSNTTVTVETTEDLLLVRNGGPPSRVVLHSNMDREFTLELSLNIRTEVLWLEVATEDYDSRGERLTGTHITSNKPLKVYTAKAEFTRPLQFSFAARVLHVMPPSQMWGKTFIGDVTAFQNLNVREITLHFLCTTNSVLLIKWHQGHSNLTATDTVMLQSGIYDRISKSQSNITHFTIHSDHPVLVLYEVHSYNHLTGIVEQYSSVLLQPVEWFSNVQCVYQYLPTQREQVQHISLTVNREHFDPSAIQLVAKYDDNGSYAFHRLRDYEDSYTLYEVEGYYLLYLNITSIGHQQTLHSIRHINNSCAEMGATVYSYGHSNNSRVSYSNGYHVDKSSLSSIKRKQPNPTTTYPYSSSHHDSSEALTTTYPYSSSHHDSSEALTTYSSSHHETLSSTLPTTTEHDTYTTKFSDAPRLALLPSSSTSNKHDTHPTNSPPHTITMPLPITPQHDPKTSSRIDRLATGMGAMSGGLFVLLVLVLSVSVCCWWRRRKRQGRTSYHMHDMFPIARYSRLEEPPEGEWIEYCIDGILSCMGEQI